MAANPDRLTALDASFLHLEDGTAHMHVASVCVFEGPTPSWQELIDHVESRLHLVPRYRQRLAFVPFGQGRPRWVDDPQLNLAYHIRHTALPAPGSEAQLKELAGRVFGQQLDRDKPLWEIWLVDGLESGGFALLTKTHHALVDGISGVDIATVLFDMSPEGNELPAAERSWLPRPAPGGAQLFSEALVERATVPGEAVRTARAILRGPRAMVSGARTALSGVSSMVMQGVRQAPASPYNVKLGPHRRFTWVRTSLDDVKAIKNRLGGTVNDVVLATVTGALRRHLRRRGVQTEGLTLRAMVPVSVRSQDQRGALGNKVAAMMAPLPVWAAEPEQRLALVSAEMEHLKSSNQAVGAQVLTELTGFAPATVMSQAARLLSRQRVFNLVVTNVPGPQTPFYLLGRRMADPFPMVPLAPGQAIGIALLSYDGKLNVGLLGDYDALYDLDDFADDLRDSLDELARAAGLDPAHATARPAEAATAAAAEAPLSGS